MPIESADAQRPQQGELPTQKRKKTFVLPPYAEPEWQNWTFLALTDGNNRLHGLNAGYDDGGKNVIEIAEYLAKRGDVGKFVACIMSPDNAEKRTEDFFWKMYQAVSALGLRIDSKKTLIKDNIVLEYSGDLEALKERGESAKAFAEMVEVVCEKTKVVENPRLKLVLGINYNNNIALEHNANIIYRSGMEEEDTARLSGLKTHTGIRNIGSTTLWPKVQIQEVGGKIDTAKNTPGANFHLGHDQEKTALISQTYQDYKIKDTEVTIPFSGPVNEMAERLKKLANKDQLKITELRSDEGIFSGWEISPVNNKQNIATRIIPGYMVVEEIIRNSYDNLIAPGQNVESLHLPNNPQVHYANVHTAGDTPEEICKAINAAYKFNTTHEQYQGGERRQSSTRIVPLEPELSVSLGHLQTLNYLTAGMDHMSSEEIAKNIAGVVKEFSSFDLSHYELTADIFATKLLQWAKERGAPHQESREFQALTCYILISFFIPYKPGSPEWEKLATQIAKYMIKIYTLDEAIFDKIMNDETISDKEKSIKIRKAKNFFQTIIENAKNGNDSENLEIPDEKDPDPYRKLPVAWEEFIRDFKNTAHVEAQTSWINSISDFFNCSEKEFEAKTSLQATIDRMNNPSTREETIQQVHERYSEKKPEFIKRKVGEILSDTNFNETNSVGAQELKFWMYVIDIHESIGAGLVYKTAALSMDKQEITPERMMALEEICMLSNVANRIANDIAGHLNRDLKDKDNKIDSCSIMMSNAKSQKQISEGLFKLKLIQEEVEEEFNRKVEELKTIWPEMAFIIKRATIGIEIYKEKHPRKVTLQKMHEYLRRYAHFGM